MKEYITIEDKQYRVTHSMAALAMYAELTGRKTIDEMSHVEKMSPKDLIAMMYCSMYMGEKLEKRELAINSPQELGMMIGVGTMQEYVRIFAKQMSAEIPAKAKDHRLSEDVKKKRQRWPRLKAWLSGGSQ